MHTSDVLILGGGVAGLSAAIRLAELRSDITITVLTKSTKEESNTRWAQGGVAVVWNTKEDNHEKHIADTIDAGDGLCNEEIVRIVVEEGPIRVQEIIDWGARFDKEDDGSYNLGMEGGHSEHRIMHYKDITGREIQRVLIEKAASYSNIHTLEHYFALDLMTQHHLGRNLTRLSPDIACYGAYVLNKETNEIQSKV